jgi:apolipoprotein D and lipocalin family protein
MRRWMGLALLLSVVSGMASSQTVQTAKYVDLKRYVGTWYEIARFPNRFQKDCVANVTAHYVARPDGQIDVVNRCDKAGGEKDEAAGRARIADPATNAKLEVRFAPDWLGWLPFVWADYWILELPDDYSYVAIGEPSREYLWILSRKPGLDDATYDDLVNRLTAQGFDTAKLVKTRQTISQ